MCLCTLLYQLHTRIELWIDRNWKDPAPVLCWSCRLHSFYFHCLKGYLENSLEIFSSSLACSNHLILKRMKIKSNYCWSFNNKVVLQLTHEWVVRISIPRITTFTVTLILWLHITLLEYNILVLSIKTLLWLIKLKLFTECKKWGD